MKINLKEKKNYANVMALDMFNQWLCFVDNKTKHKFILKAHYMSCTYSNM